MATEASSTARTQELQERVDAIFAEWDKPDSPGCALGVIQDGELIYARGYGMANLDLDVPISPASVFHVASVSKQFCAVAVALLAEEGKLSLDDDVRAYVPELPDFGQTITIRHFLNHTSGMRDQYGLFRLAGWREDDVQLNDDVIDFALRHRRLNFPPGSEYAYCNTSYTLLALIVSRVSGQSFREFVQTRLLDPLGMTSSHFHDDHSEIVKGRASAYAPREEGGFKVNDSNVDAVGAICLYTTVEDLAKWVRNYRQHTVAGEALDQAMTPGVLNDGERIRYGFGLMLGSYRGFNTVGHGGSDSGYRSQVLWFPEADFGVVILANLSSFKPGSLARKVADIYLADRLRPDELLDAPAVSLSEEELAAKAGLYRDARTCLTRRVELHDGKLVVPTGFGEDLELTPLGPDRFRAGDPPHEVRFVTNAEGVLELHELSSEGKPAIFAAVEQAEPKAEDLAAYAGSYYCPEIGTAYRVVVRDGTLVVRHRKMRDRELKPAITDAFTDKMTNLVFSRDGRGDVSGFDLFTDRIRYLRFERQ